MLDTYLRSRGGIVSRRALIAAGVTDAQLRHAIRSGEIERVRDGWFAARGTDRDTVRAVASGGRLTCASALALFDVWCFRQDQLHIAVDRGSRRRVTSAVVHGGNVRALRGADAAVDSPLEALERLSRCASRIGFIVAADSAVNKSLVTVTQLASVIGTSTRGQRLIAALDGASESGIESIVRVALRGRGVRLRSQVPIHGVGRVDLVVGDRLVIEADGFEWHSSRSAFEEDRRRDLALTALGYVVVRVSFDRVVNAWRDVEAEIAGLILRREHEWRARHRALGQVPRVHGR